MIPDDLIDRLSSEAGRRLSEKSRAGRAKAIAGLRQCRVLVTQDGAGTWEEMFDRPPTLAQLVARVGPRAYVVGIGMRIRARRERRAAIAATLARPRIAAE
jgi:hypothetical protein